MNIRTSFLTLLLCGLLLPSVASAKSAFPRYDDDAFCASVAAGTADPERMLKLCKLSEFASMVKLGKADEDALNYCVQREKIGSYVSLAYCVEFEYAKAKDKKKPEPKKKQRWPNGTLMSTMGGLAKIAKNNPEQLTQVLGGITFSCFGNIESVAMLPYPVDSTGGEAVPTLIGVHGFYASLTTPPKVDLNQILRGDYAVLLCSDYASFDAERRGARCEIVALFHRDSEGKKQLYYQDEVLSRMLNTPQE